jgi:triosephosphate isomerase
MQKNLSRKIFIGGNFKSNGDISFIKSHAKVLNETSFDSKIIEVAVCPSYIHLSLARNEFDPKIIISSQNVSKFDSGPYTGEISAAQLKDLGIFWTLIGHSERRENFGDTEEVIGEKIKQALNNGLSAIICVGEKLSDREANRTMEVIKFQMNTLLKNVSDWSRVVIAYEPVWAIGTGKTATPDLAQEVHVDLRKWIANNVSETVANEIRIIYGGSVSDINCKDLIIENDIDGFLIGAASLKPKFKDIIESCNNMYK